jgi:hypothetical protein
MASFRIDSGSPEILQFSRRRKSLISNQPPQPFVRLQTFLFLCIAPLLIACAYQGTIVEKAGRPLPFAYSLGIDASYKFALRDRLGRVRWQLVPADVFNSYRVGDYFDDANLVPPRHRCYSKDEREVAPICPYETIPIRVPRFQPIPLSPRAVRTLQPDAAARH